jgi:hypothetical protein
MPARRGALIAILVIGSQDRVLFQPSIRCRFQPAPVAWLEGFEPATDGGLCRVVPICPPGPFSQHGRRPLGEQDPRTAAQLACQVPRRHKAHETPPGRTSPARSPSFSPRSGRHALWKRSAALEEIRGRPHARHGLTFAGARQPSRGRVLAAGAGTGFGGALRGGRLMCRPPAPSAPRRSAQRGWPGLPSTGSGCAAWLPTEYCGACFEPPRPT